MMNFLKLAFKEDSKNKYWELTIVSDDHSLEQIPTVPGNSVSQLLS
jgi:hypothetical protein